MVMNSVMVLVIQYFDDAIYWCQNMLTMKYNYNKNVISDECRTPWCYNWIDGWDWDGPPVIHPIQSIQCWCWSFSPSPLPSPCSSPMLMRKVSGATYRWSTHCHNHHRLYNHNILQHTAASKKHSETHQSQVLSLPWGESNPLLYLQPIAISTSPSSSPLPSVTPLPSPPSPPSPPSLPPLPSSSPLSPSPSQIFLMVISPGRERERTVSTWWRLWALTRISIRCFWNTSMRISIVKLIKRWSMNHVCLSACSSRGQFQWFRNRGFL